MWFRAVLDIAAGIALIAWMAALSLVDIRERRLPNALTLPGAAVILAVAAVCGRGLPAVLGAAALAGAYLVVHLVAPAAMGAGDVKLAVGLGALTGALSVDIWALAALGAPLLTAAWGLLTGMRTVPHGPSMCLSTTAALLLAICGG
jgi:leader peptidase (prepilin peptidase)/N-methyltransferase